ncbi:MAG: hypothetical protein AABW80_05405 [Nanoarchaeota archaeon]
MVGSKKGNSWDGKSNIASISIKINNYSDIFSSFDSRNYSEKAFSDDFLSEAKKACKDKASGQVALYIDLPKEHRNGEDEIVIKRRMREHFKRHYIILLNEIKDVKRKGIFMAILGVLFITIATYFSPYASKSFIIDFFLILLEPAGWFTAWTGLDQIYYTLSEKKPDLDFNERMSNAEIVFLSN